MRWRSYISSALPDHGAFTRSGFPAARGEPDDYFARATTALLLLGAGLRMAQYALGQALWYDELALVRNLIEKPVRALLTTPLDHAQLAPSGFLLVERAALAALGNNEYALRLFPLLCSLIALPLFARLARSVLSRAAAVLAVLLFSLSPAMIAFGSQVKPYSTDIAGAVLLTALTLDWRQRREQGDGSSGAVLLGTAGFASVWFSYAAVLTLAGLGMALLIEWALRRKPIDLRKLGPIVLFWVVGMTGAALLAAQSVSPSTHAYMQAYWAGGFMPFPPRSAEDALWLWRAVRSLFQRELLYPLPAAGILLAAVGALAMIRRARWPVLFIIAPLATALVASAAHRYPLGERVSLFLVPGMMLLLAAGVDWLRRAVEAGWRPLGAVVGALAVLAAVHTLYVHSPFSSEKDVRDVLAYLTSRRQQEDAVYVFYNAAHAVAYYGPRHGLLPPEVIVGDCPGGDTRKLLHEFDRFRGRPRLWVIISHAVGPFREREAMLGYLNALGTERDRIVVGSPRLGSSAYLYDLSRADRPGVVSAEAYILPAREKGVREFPCPPLSRSISRSATSGRH